MLPLKLPTSSYSPSLVRVTILGWSDAGLPLIQLPDPATPAVEAQMLSSLGDDDIDQAIADQAIAYAQLVTDDHPLLVGVTRPPKQATTSPQPTTWTVVDDNGKVLVEAEHSLELRCGQASILLRADGKIRMHGVDVSSRARRTQRIKGGTVRIN